LVIEISLEKMSDLSTECRISSVCQTEGQGRAEFFYICTKNI